MNAPALQVQLSDPEAWALAQLLKRIGWSQWRALAVDDDEADAMRSACEQVSQALAERGYAPR